jgi:hypothetical protein
VGHGEIPGGGIPGVGTGDAVARDMDEHYGRRLSNYGALRSAKTVLEN